LGAQLWAGVENRFGDKYFGRLLQAHRLEGTYEHARKRDNISIFFGF
jgi:hypothetical protein